MKIVFKNKDGTVGIITPTKEILRKLTIEHVAKKDVPAGLPWRIVQDHHIPQDREFRDAWTDDYPTHTIDVHLPKAKEIFMSRVRVKRNEAFIKLGFPHKLHPELENNLTSATKKELQKLRDIPQNINLTDVLTVQELKEKWPEGL